MTKLYVSNLLCMALTFSQITDCEKARMGCFWKVQKVFPDRHLPMSLKRMVFKQCILPAMTRECQTWSLTKALEKKTTTTNKLETSQRAMERRMLNVKPKDRIRNTTIKKRTE